MTGSENCFNQIDDDDDGQIDCEDDDCLEGACVPMAPEGWDQASVVFAKDVESLVSCAAPWIDARDASSGLIAPAASCADCSCGSPSASCSTPTLTSYTNPNCPAGSEEEVTMLVDGMCATIFPGDFDAFVVTPPQPSGSCPSAGGQATLPPVSWQEQARVCTGGSLGAGCSGDDVCAPATSDMPACIAREGDEACPEGFPDKTLLYDGFTDERECSDCTCAPNVQCMGSVQVHIGGLSCFGPPDITEPANGMCQSVGRGDTEVSIEYTEQMMAGPCAIGGGEPTGEATPTEPTTVCCVAPPDPS